MEFNFEDASSTVDVAEDLQLQAKAAELTGSIVPAHAAGEKK